MLRFDPNLRWLFTELPMPERYEAAARAGFRGVEVAFPYEYPAAEIARRLADNGLALVQILTPCDWAGGERGIASLPGREADFRRSVETALEYAVQVGRPLVHAMAGNLPAGADRARCEATFLENIAFAADAAARESITIILEPCCTARFPDYYYKRLEEGVDAIRKVGRPNVKLCFDTFHVQMEEGAVTTRLTGEIARRFGHAGLSEDSITVRLNGSAGQSFGAFAARGVTLELHGEANDYVGKGLSGGRLVIRHPKGSKFLPNETVLIGNTALYGATCGEAFFGGVAGERFAVRNSGATAVVEGVGDHACEYMTGGTVVVLGRTGRNFAAGMSGGLAFVLDTSRDFEMRCNRGLVELSAVVESSDAAVLKDLLEQHARLTGSARARHLLTRWDTAVHEFIRVIPTEYRKALRAARDQQAREEAERRG